MGGVGGEAPRLLGIIEPGGYPNLAGLYRRLGLEVERVNSRRKVQAETVLRRALATPAPSCTSADPLVKT